MQDEFFHIFYPAHPAAKRSRISCNLALPTKLFVDVSRHQPGATLCGWKSFFLSFVNVTDCVPVPGLSLFCSSFITHRSSFLHLRLCIEIFSFFFMLPMLSLQLIWQLHFPLLLLKRKKLGRERRFLSMIAGMSRRSTPPSRCGKRS